MTTPVNPAEQQARIENLHDRIDDLRGRLAELERGVRRPEFGPLPTKREHEEYLNARANAELRERAQRAQRESDRPSTGSVSVDRIRESESRIIEHLNQVSAKCDRILDDQREARTPPYPPGAARRAYVTGYGTTDGPTISCASCGVNLVNVAGRAFELSYLEALICKCESAALNADDAKDSAGCAPAAVSPKGSGRYA